MWSIQGLMCGELCSPANLRVALLNGEMLRNIAVYVKSGFTIAMKTIITISNVGTSFHILYVFGL